MESILKVSDSLFNNGVDVNHSKAKFQFMKREVNYSKGEVDVDRSSNHMPQENLLLNGPIPLRENQAIGRHTIERRSRLNGIHTNDKTTNLFVRRLEDPFQF